MRIASALLAASLLAMPAVAQRYNAVILQTLDGRAIQGGGLNNRGDVVGGIGANTPVVRRADGSITLLDTLGGNRAFANAISDTGLVAGQARTGTTGATSQATLQALGGNIAVIPLPTGGNSAQALDVNAAGVAVGVFRDPAANGLSRAFRYGTDRLETLAPPSGQFFTRAIAVNAGGNALVESGPLAVRWNSDGSTLVLQGPDVPPGGFGFSVAGDINDANLTAGSVFSSTAMGPNQSQLVLWGLDGTIVRRSAPRPLDSFAYGLNNRGDVVGAFVTPLVFDPITGMQSGGDFSPFLWRTGGAPVDLNALVSLADIQLTSANDINDRGQILASGQRLSNGFRVDVLLSPVPEPGTWAMMIVGFGLVGAAMRRRSAPKASGALAT